MFKSFLSVVILGMSLLTSQVFGGTNNPGNIIKNPENQWVGSVKCEGRFECFSSPQYGVRAMAIVLRSYHERHGIKTIDQTINRWAPPSENDTESYIRFMEGYVNRGQSDCSRNLYSDRGCFVAMISGIIRFETGKRIFEGINLNCIMVEVGY